MVDIADKIRKKLLDEIKTLEFEFHNELPKELMKASLSSAHDSASFTNAWPISPC
jgi:hypothetical protein